MKLGIDCLLTSKTLFDVLKSKRVALCSHPAGVTRELILSAEAVFAHPNINLTALFGPQHGVRGEKQDNMMESQDFKDPVMNIPVFSLYGKVRRPTRAMMDTFDVLLVDLQDIGCRIYTFLTTLFYLIEACEEFKKEIWILDRPNPAGRKVEGFTLEAGWESFVGFGQIPMRHGMTLGELTGWIVHKYNKNLNFKVIKMENYSMEQKFECAWPSELVWVNPSPNAASVNMARCFSGTVLLEGTNLSEGRGTTHPLEMIGAPNFDTLKILSWMKEKAPQWMTGCRIRPCYFEPTFHKHQGKLCSGFQIHAEGSFYDSTKFSPFRLIALYLKAVKTLYPGFELWRDFPYEYETNRLAIDVINGGPRLREWVEDLSATCAALEATLSADEQTWLNERKNFLIY